MSKRLARRIATCVLAALGFVQTPTARENQIYLPKELLLEHW